MSKLYQFQLPLFGSNRSPANVIKGNRFWIQQYIPFDEFQELFGGYLLFREPQAPNPDMEGKALGVWGTRNMPKLRCVLRERGAIFTLIKDEGPIQSLAIRCP